MTYKIQTPTGVVQAARVTEVIRSVLAAPQLERWKLEQVASHAAQQVFDGAYDGPGDCVDSWERTSRGAAERGSRIHAWIAAVVNDAEPPSISMSDKPLADAFTDWLVDHPWRVLGTEVTVTTRDNPVVAGTLDALFAEGDDVILCDWKTCKKLPKKPYLDHIAQIGAYSSLRHRLSAAGTVGPRVPTVNSAAVVYLAPEGARTLYVDLFTAHLVWGAITTLYGVRGRP